jgi:hypothetical protein
MLREVNDPLLAGMSVHDLETVHRFFQGIVLRGYDAIDVARGFGARG